MTRQPARTHAVLASLLSLLIILLAAAPATAAPQRVRSQEKFAHKLVNCLRTGGKVTRSGKCIGYGSGKYSKYRKPLRFSQRISNKVAYPWAERTVRANLCGHSLAGSTVEKRFRSVRLRHAESGENIGCATSWPARRMVVTMVRWWYAERHYNGWHWRQLKDKDFKSAGYGVAKLKSGRTRLVVDFYGKPVG